MHQEITSPIPSSRKFFHVPKSFRRRIGVHCFCSSSKNSVLQFRRQCHFFRTAASISLVHALAPCSLLLLLIQCAARSFGWTQASVATCLANAGVFRGGRTARGGQQGPALPYDAPPHRPHHQKLTRGRLLPRACYNTVTVA